MSVHFKRLALPTTLTDLLEAREQARASMMDARKALGRAEKTLGAVGHYLMPIEAQLRYSHAQVVQRMDSRLWRRAFDLTGFRQLMDAEAVAGFERDLDRNPPSFTEDNIRSTFASLFQDKDLMFRRGVVNVFRHLSREYRTNDKEPFKVASKIILEFMATDFYGPLRVNYGANAVARLDDINRVFRTLDDEVFRPRELEQAINGAWAKGEDYEDDYFRIRGFKKGTAHLWFKRPDLLDRVNELIAEHYGDNVLARSHTPTTPEAME